MKLFAVLCVLSLVAVQYCQADVSIRDICNSLQKYEILFTNKCRLEADKIADGLESFKKFSRNFPGDTSVTKYLQEGFKDSTKYFQQTYPKYNAQYQAFENAISTIFNKAKRNTRNITIDEFVNAFKLMEKPYNEIIENADRECLTEGQICPVLEAMLNIDVDNVLKMSVETFLDEISKNIVKFLKVRKNEPFKFESIIMRDLNQRMAIEGTNLANVKKIRQIVVTDFFKYLQQLNTYTPEPPTTTTTTREVVRKTTLEAVSQAVYLSVPIIIAAVGVIVCIVVVVFYYKMQPNKGGQPGKTKPVDERF